MAELENLNNDSNSSWGGIRPNAGRPKGSMNEATKLRMEVKAAFQERVAKNADALFNAQFNLAKGEQYLMWKHKVGSGAKERTVVEVVDDLEIIKSYINDELDVGDGEFYYISTKPANGMAIDSLLDRSFGKSEQNLKLGNDPENPLTMPTNPELVANWQKYLEQQTKDGQP
jgi:hypothetical protein